MRRLALTVSAVALAVATGSTLAIARPWSAGLSASAASAPAADVLGRTAETGRLQLVAFLNTQPDTAATLSRDQTVTLASLLTQYQDKGLAVKIVDESGAPRSALINAYYDWNLGQIQLTGDPQHGLAQKYQATSTPTTVLIDAAGSVIARWGGYTPTQNIVQTIQAELT